MLPLLPATSHFAALVVRAPPPRMHHGAEPHAEPYDARAAWLARISGDPVERVVEYASMQQEQVGQTTHDEAAAKAAWLAKVDAPWTRGAVAPAATDEAAAKAAWLAKVDAFQRQSWMAAGNVSPGESVAPMPAAPYPTTDAEAAAKAAWLAKLDAQQHSWITDVPAPNSPDEAAAKAAWLAKTEQQASWVGVGAARPAVAPEATAAQVYHAGVETTDAEAAAKAAWLAKVDAHWKSGGGLPAPSTPDEATAKAAWLARIDAQNQAPWVGAQDATRDTAAAPASVASTPMETATADDAKAKWLASLSEEPAWVRGGAAAAAAPVDDAKAKWLASLDAQPSWMAKAGNPNFGVPISSAAVDQDATRDAAPSATRDAAPSVSVASSAPQQVASEEAAKQAWLAKVSEQQHQTPAWGAPVRVERDAAPVWTPVHLKVRSQGKAEAEAVEVASKVAEAVSLGGEDPHIAPSVWAKHYVKQRS